MTMNVRVRYAPSPTGYQHVGNLRTALFNWLFARHEGGRFIIRIEDTDRERSDEKYVNAILDDFRWLGLDWDEGPDAGGPHGPYRQSERLDTYRTYADKLLAEGKAYRCWCTPEELEERRRAAMESGGTPGYDGRCRDLTNDQHRTYESEGRKSVLRFRVPDDERIVFDDMVLGETVFESSLLGDFVIVKSDGWPTYHFGVVVDDALMEITHVIRAEGHLSNTPLHVLLFEALGFMQPRFAHLPSVLSEDGKGKLSKRLGALSIVEYRRRGYLPEALFNYMALLGWSPGDDREIMTRDEIIQVFTLQRVKKSSARFDGEKLLSMNGKYITSADPGELADTARQALDATGYDVSTYDDAWMRKLVAAYQQRLNTLGELPEKVRYLFVEVPEYDEKAVKKALQKGDGCGMLRAVHGALEGLDDWTEKSVESALKAIQEARGVGFGKVAQPIRVAVTGTSVSPGIFETLDLLGRDRALARMQHALEQFGDKNQPC